MIMKMNKKVLLFCLSLLMGGVTSAQHFPPEVNGETKENQEIRPKVNREEFKKKLQAFITEKANLTAEEAGVIFPSFFELRGKQHDLHKKRERSISKIRKEKLSEADCERILRFALQLEKQSAEMEIRYVRQWKSKLPASVILRVLEADRQFSRQTFMRMASRKKS